MPSGTTFLRTNTLVNSYTILIRLAGVVMSLSLDLRLGCCVGGGVAALAALVAAAAAAGGAGTVGGF